MRSWGRGGGGGCTFVLPLLPRLPVPSPPDGYLLPASEETLMLTWHSLSSQTPWPMSSDSADSARALNGSREQVPTPVSPLLPLSYEPSVSTLTFYDHLIVWAALLVVFFGFLLHGRYLKAAKTGRMLICILAFSRHSF